MLPKSGYPKLRTEFGKVVYLSSIFSWSLSVFIIFPLSITQAEGFFISMIVRIFDLSFQNSGSPCTCTDSFIFNWFATHPLSPD